MIAVLAFISSYVERHTPFIASLPFSSLLFLFSCLLSYVKLLNELRDCCARIYIFVSDRVENIYHPSYLIKQMNVCIVL